MNFSRTRKYIVIIVWFVVHNVCLVNVFLLNVVNKVNNNVYNSAINVRVTFLSLTELQRRRINGVARNLLDVIQKIIILCI